MKALSDNRISAALVVGGASAGGAIAAQQPLLALALLGVVVLLLISVLGPNLESVFMGALALLLVGYLFQSRAFAYIGIAPLYLSEAVLALGLLSLVFVQTRIRLTAIHLWLIAFMVIGLVGTIPFISTYGIDALRDAAQWYYALFAILVAGFLTESRIVTFLRLYNRVLPLLVIWLAAMPIVFVFLPDLPNFPGSPMPVLYQMKPGDRGVILAGLGAFVFTGLYRRFRGGLPLSKWAFWMLWLLAAGFVSIANRGGFLAMTSAIGFVALLRPSTEWLRLLLIGSLLLTAGFIANPTIDLGSERKVSADQLMTNIASVFSSDTGNTGSVQGTRKWRLQWWSNIYDDTVKGPYFWSGQGFGINLADEYGFQTDPANHSLRSPHNGHVTILARMGVPGIIAWLMLQCVFFRKMLQSYFRARNQGQIWADVIIWLLAMWIAALVNASFDVYLESPYGAIPFFCIMGAGIAVIRIQRGGESHAYPSRP